MVNNRRRRYENLCDLPSNCYVVSRDRGRSRLRSRVLLKKYISFSSLPLMQFAIRTTK